MDVYKAADASAPAIMAAKSVEEGSKCLEVPDFRPNAKRKAGQPPKKQSKE